MNSPNIRQAKAWLFLKEVKTEMEKVHWPSKKEAIRLTMIVIIASIIMAIFIGSLDLGFTKLMEFILKK